ncbi:hypothetical protein BAJUN_01110 [Bajunvirus bajun]|uniref:Uncharacterized protein n=1 Tax=Brevundimonas phage vB_BgoS-Bajun TaxID=2948594 RepID=A0A9E7N4H6_9CAUD|nr:hypothetical protein BAJUN_01110 [Brevundimonas phage vB_BgoS-Bajun]
MTVPFTAEASTAQLDTLVAALRTFRAAGTSGRYLLRTADGRVLCHQRVNNNAFELNAPTLALEGMRVWQGLTQKEITALKLRYERQGDGTPLFITCTRTILEAQEAAVEALLNAVGFDQAPDLYDHVAAGEAAQSDQHLEHWL